ncbi:hypothetical protein [Pseudomonas sp. 2FG]|uniref:hypothetical protein n=1 Tax=Pseudomonas sp. 2FG TaxID=2502191 RepID=UPI001485C261|nr:hypothetical protein [Pseudomonas sp. 2FG]
MMLRRAGHDQQRSMAQCQRVLDARLMAERSLALPRISGQTNTRSPIWVMGD